MSLSSAWRITCRRLLVVLVFSNTIELTLPAFHVGAFLFVVERTRQVEFEQGFAHRIARVWGVVLNRYSSWSPPPSPFVEHYMHSIPTLCLTASLIGTVSPFSAGGPFGADDWLLEHVRALTRSSHISIVFEASKMHFKDEYFKVGFNIRSRSSIHGSQPTPYTGKTLFDAGIQVELAAWSISLAGLTLKIYGSFGDPPESLTVGLILLTRSSRPSIAIEACPEVGTELSPFPRSSPSSRRYAMSMFTFVFVCTYVGVGVSGSCTNYGLNLIHIYFLSNSMGVCDGSNVGHVNAILAANSEQERLRSQSICGQSTTRPVRLSVFNLSVLVDLTEARAR
ncbi:hypothetical protein FB45DRAFT_1017099 [Roridomyces roridus]|uniref:Uncharacterized protein n=1 Tax=Roridomyces roridus TaxID=1738132 RepID=A0AAD7CHU2_9AGAR|nr:hypothetical protein FB45DRAFT_1017099 [Roridomyces roridus]